MVRVGAGVRVYEQAENWEKLPEGWVLGQTAIVTAVSYTHLTLPTKRIV